MRSGRIQFFHVRLVAYTDLLLAVKPRTVHRDQFFWRVASVVQKDISYNTFGVFITLVVTVPSAMINTPEPGILIDTRWIMVPQLLKQCSMLFLCSLFGPKVGDIHGFHYQNNQSSTSNPKTDDSKNYASSFCEDLCRSPTFAPELFSVSALALTLFFV